MDSGPGDETLLLRLLATALPPSWGQVSALGFHQTETVEEVAS